MIHLLDAMADEHPTSNARRMNVHMIEARKQMRKLSASSKLNTQWTFLTYLRDIGRDAAKAWIDTHFDAIGERSTIDLKEMFSTISPERKHIPRDLA